MPIIRRSITCLAASILLVVLVAACADRAYETNSAPPGTAAARTVAAATETVPPLTDKELAWLNAIPAVSAKVGKSLAAITNLTPAGMAKLGNVLRSCTRDLVRPGVPGARLQPVFAVVTKACKEYDRGAACFAKAASIGIPYAGTQAERDQSKALDCGFAASREAILLLADAENMGTEITGGGG